MHARSHTTSPVHHSSHRQPAFLVALSACDHGLIPVSPPACFSPLIQEGRLPSLLVHPASLPIPPLWVTQRRLSSGQHAVSCPPGRRTTLRIHNPYPSRRTSELPLAAEMKLLCHATEETHIEGASPFQSFGQILNPKGTVYQAIRLLQTKMVASYFFFFFFPHVLFVSSLSFRVGSFHVWSRGVFTHGAPRSSCKPHCLLHVGLVNRRA